MSISRISDSDKSHKKSFHRRNDSGELDVFEAARYFSGHPEVSGHNSATFTQKLVREERQQGWKSGGRISLDMPIMRNSIPSQAQVMEKQAKDKKYKQPSSPGGRLASFLNSLFHQTSRKKKSKSTTTTTQSMKDYEDDSPGGRRKRRSSISHFRSGSSNTDSKSIYSSSSSGFRTPPPYPQTKTIRDLRSYSDHKQPVASLPKYDDARAKNHTTSVLQNEVLLDGKFKNFGNGILEKDREFRKFGEVDEDGDSDSSSDLFELENYDLGYYSSGLPVYETTHMDTIKRGAPISNGTM
ncbi:protein BIG GRAIN 1-like E [Actinidia eriantha]|uniref:protein BIG GRAIN 1-like E n=1 Tax=Actinidia eriantha TaxID=165200 RepID=UPI002582A5CC|nr:protein BIG GRAIN 1-like E [Actinidia eriantha]